MLETITNFIIENWLMLSLITSTFLSAFLAQEIADILLIPFKVVGFVFKFIFGLFKKPVNELKRAKRLERT